ncbi:MAG: signal recognition particle-docking protein FtsY [Fibrobacterales bacterium]
MGFFNTIKKGLTKTRESFSNELGTILGKGVLTEEKLEEIEEQLIRADIGVDTVFALVDSLRDQALGKSLSADQLMNMLGAIASDLLVDPKEINWGIKPHVVLIIGVNGAGKTTSIGKLSHYYKKQGKKVLIAAADTFRAAAIEQLEVWADRTDAEFVKHQEGSDAASVVYDAYEAAQARDCDVLLVDTAGRLHNKEHLMEELKKIVRILRKHDESLPHESILVIDGNTGQNTVNQIKRFNHAIPLDGLIVTKLDGTAKGGSVISMSNELKLPIDWLGMGESIDDLVPFSKEEYIKGLFSTDE